MVHSMTSFSRTLGNYEHLSFNIDIRTVNSKSLEIQTKFPFYLRELETEVKAIVSQRLKRGKIEVSFDIDMSNTESKVGINKTLVQEYFTQIREVSPDLSDADLWPIVYKMSGVFQDSTISEIDVDLLKTACIQSLTQGIDRLIVQREREGKAVKAVFEQNMGIISDHLRGTIKSTDDRPGQIRDRLQQKVETLLGDNFDQNRLEQEIIYYVEKFDINEETTRLEEHLRYFNEVINDDSTFVKGKKLGFIAQEIGREVNTIGSKVNDSHVQRHVILMKEALERVKEQVLNIA